MTEEQVFRQFLESFGDSNKDFKIPVVFFIGTLLGGFITIFYRFFTTSK